MLSLAFTGVSFIFLMVLGAGIEPARPQGTQDFLTCYGFRRLQDCSLGSGLYLHLLLFS